MREKYYEEYGEYPAEIADKYRDNFNVVYEGLINQFGQVDDEEIEREIIERIIKRSEELIIPFLNELNELLN